MSSSGQLAEAAAATYLQAKGYEILQTNWRTPWCEIDIVAKRHNVIYCCEVKYRGSQRQGQGLDYVTPAKLQKMRLGAASWTHLHNWRGQYQLLAIEVSGPGFAVTGVVGDIMTE